MYHLVFFTTTAVFLDKFLHFLYQLKQQSILYRRVTKFTTFP